MIVFPNAKINIGLNVIEKRLDGYHNIQSCFYPVPWKDALEVIEADSFSFTSSGIVIPGKSNLVVNAYNLLKEDFELPPVKVHLHKNIPIGAGLGGGSSDAAFMLKLLNEKFDLKLTQSGLEDYAGQLGSDCPFFISNNTCFVEGTGDKFSSVSVDLTGFYLTIVYPELHIGTHEAYSKLSPKMPELSLKELIESTPLAQWKNHIKNDFEQSVPQSVLSWKAKLNSVGAIYTSMTGSGSAVYGIFGAKPELDSIPHPHIICKL